MRRALVDPDDEEFMRNATMWMGVAALLLATVPAQATTVLKVPVEQMTQGADLVVRAVVRDVMTQTDATDRRALSTRVAFDVQEVLKGHASGPSLTIVLPGGANEQWKLIIPGMPEFAPGEEVVLFLERTRLGWVPSGLSMGKYTVRRPPQDGPARVHRSMRDLHPVERRDGVLRDADAFDPQDDMTLDALRQAIRRGIEGGAR